MCHLMRLATRNSRIAEFKALWEAARTRHRVAPCRFDGGLAKLLSIDVDRGALHAGLERQGRRLAAARAGSHTGEVLQGVEVLQGLPDHLQDDRLQHPDAVRFLMDLPCDALFSTATVIVTNGTGQITVTPTGSTKATYAAEALLALLGLDSTLDIHIGLDSNIAKGRGLGSSSADVRAVLKALACVLELRLDNDGLDKLTVAAEGATNPASRDPTLFCHRLGFTIAHRSRWPDVAVLAFDDTSAPNVDTDAYRPAVYDAEAVGRFGLLARAALAAITASDGKGLGIVASTSADINDQFLPRRHGSCLDNLRRIVRATDALGYAVSHSGTVGGILYATSSVDLPRRLQQAAEQLIASACSIITRPFQLGGRR